MAVTNNGHPSDTLTPPGAIASSVWRRNSADLLAQSRAMSSVTGTNGSFGGTERKSSGRGLRRSPRLETACGSRWSGPYQHWGHWQPIGLRPHNGCSVSKPSNVCRSLMMRFSVRANPLWDREHALSSNEIRSCQPVNCVTRAPTRQSPSPERPGV